MSRRAVDPDDVDPLRHMTDSPDTIDEPATDPLPALQDHADVLEDAADATDDEKAADAYRVLAAVARGESPPRDVARRVVDRARIDR